MRHGPARLGLLLFAMFCAACGAERTSAPPSVTAVQGVPQASTLPPESTAAPSRAAILPPSTETLPPAPRAFTENFDSASPYWTFLQVDNGPAAPGPATQAGSLSFDLAAANQWTAEIYESQDYTDVRVEARLDFGAGGQGAAGVICRYGRTSGWYEFNIYPDQSYMLLFGQWLAEGVARYTPLVRSESEKIQPGANDIGLWCEGNTLTPYVNGTQLRKRQENTLILNSGKIGISAASFEDLPVAISYDWVQVSEP
jgi:hypothetical protein